jgi:hypothetical protein
MILGLAGCALAAEIGKDWKLVLDSRACTQAASERTQRTGLDWSLGMEADPTGQRKVKVNGVGEDSEARKQRRTCGRRTGKPCMLCSNKNSNFYAVQT